MYALLSVIVALLTVGTLAAIAASASGCSLTYHFDGPPPPPPAQPAASSPPHAGPPLNYDPGESGAWRDVRQAGVWLRSQDWAGPWDADEVGAAAVFAALAGTDAGLSSAKISARSSCYEADPMITFAAGTRRPSSADFAVTGVLGVGLGLGVAAILPPLWRDYFLSALIGLESYNVAAWASDNCPWGARAASAPPAPAAMPRTPFGPLPRPAPAGTGTGMPRSPFAPLPRPAPAGVTTAGGPAGWAVGARGVSAW